MNKRIKELAEQACEMKPYMVADPETFEIVQKIGYDGQPMFHRDFNREKFAELIVRECMSMCDETRANYLKHRKATIDFDEKNIFAEGEAASDVIKYKMKKHFGVEE